MKTIVTITLATLSMIVFICLAISDLNGAPSILNFIGFLGIYTIARIKCVREAIDCINSKIGKEETW